MEIVFDCSAVVACVVPDEKEPDGWQALLAESSLVVPAAWPAEIVNALLMGARRKRYTFGDLAGMLGFIGALDAELELPHLPLYASVVLESAQTHALTIYDAAYLELAQRRKLPLATLDDDLRKAAKKAKVKLV